VVEKRAVPKEEIVVRKEERIDSEVVEADLRRENVDVHRKGDVDIHDRR
jgi:stress response protein YsnF